jgi:tetratricopeptide (TPR) repeat protein
LEIEKSGNSLDGGILKLSGRDQLIELFVRGETARLVAIPLAAYEKSGHPELLVGVLVLTGDFERALAVGRVLEAKDASGVVSFYLSLGFARAGRYEEAFKRIQNLETRVSVQHDAAKRAGSAKRRVPDLLSFYLHQARGFYQFARGDSRSAAESAREALVAAESSTDPLQPLARTLSLDLLGHSLIRVGSTRRGIKTLRLAREAAIRARHESFNHAISVSLLKYEAVYGLEPRRVLSRLYRALVELKPNDSYSRSELRLELSRQLILRGNLADARRHLEEAATDILGSQNRLQTAALHLRLAWMARLEDRPADALLALQSAEKGLSPDGLNFESNRELVLKISFFRLELYRETGRLADAKRLELQIETDVSAVELEGVESRLTSRRHRILHRPDRASKSTTAMSALAAPLASAEDPFGDLMDRVQRRDDAVENDLLELGYFGLLLPMLSLNLAQTALVLGAPGSRVIVLDRGETRVSENGLKGLLGRLIMKLADGPCTRREAIETVWGYRYEADRHDRLLSVAVSRIRKALGGGQAWIEIQGDRVVLRDQVVVRFWSTGVPAKVAFSSRAVLPALSSSPNRIGQGLRIRQLQVLSELVTRGDVGVQDVVVRFGVSRASALRDLNELVALDLLVRTGETRATRYMLSGRPLADHQRFEKGF